MKSKPKKKVSVVTNHWGWRPRGVWAWLRYGWAWPLDVWGVEISGSAPPRFERRCKIGPLCFALGSFDGWPPLTHQDGTNSYCARLRLKLFGRR